MSDTMGERGESETYLRLVCVCLGVCHFWTRLARGVDEAPQLVGVAREAARLADRALLDPLDEVRVVAALAEQHVQVVELRTRRIRT